jgi:predicted amidohydrolase YtcJ
MQPDIVLLDGKVWTGLSAVPDAEALATAGDRIVAVGSSAEIAHLCGPGTERIHLEGKLVVPGFHDSHVHFAGGSLQLGRVNLKDAPDEAEFGRRLREFDRKLAPGRWITGGRWDHDRTFGGALPAAAMVDRYVPTRPVFVQRYDGHMGLANSAALRVAGITEATPDPPGGKIIRDRQSGEPTGVLQDRAMELVWRHIPAPDADEVTAAMPHGLAEAARRGITSIHDMLSDAPVSLEAYRRLAASGDLSVRAHLYWPIAGWQDAQAVAQELALRSDRLRLCGCKAFVDGSLGSGTAWFHEPYVGEPDNCGLAVVELDELQKRMTAADAAGLQLAVHAIGDRATAELLGLWEKVAEGNGPRDRRLRMEHAQHIQSKNLARFAALGAIASMQPYHCIDDARWAEARIGPKRCSEAYVFRSLIDAGVRLAFGSDWPVAPLDPLAGIEAAANRCAVDDPSREAWHAEQRTTVAEALRAYTRDAAHAVFREDELGTLEPGKLADLVVLSRDITDPANRDAIGGTDVVLTMLGGKVVYGG